VIRIIRAKTAKALSLSARLRLPLLTPERTTCGGPRRYPGLLKGSPFRRHNRDYLSTSAPACAA
jgi:hypothetical protein